MTEYWKSPGKYWCEYCRIFVYNNNVSRKQHENNPKHKEAVQNFSLNKKKQSVQEEIQQNKMLFEVKKAELAATMQMQGHSVSNGDPINNIQNKYFSKNSGFVLPSVEEQRTKQLKQNGYTPDQINELLKYEAAVKALETYNYNLSFTSPPPLEAQTSQPNNEQNHQSNYSPSRDVDSENESKESKESKGEKKNHQYHKQVHHHHRSHEKQQDQVDSTTTTTNNETTTEISSEQSLEKEIEKKKIPTNQEIGEAGKWESVDKSVFPESASENEDDDDDDKPQRDMSDFVSNNQLHQKHRNNNSTKDNKHSSKGNDGDSDNSDEEIIYEKKPASLSNHEDDDDDDEEDEKPKQITFKKRKRLGGSTQAPSSKSAKHE